MGYWNKKAKEKQDQIDVLAENQTELQQQERLRIQEKERLYRDYLSQQAIYNNSITGMFGGGISSTQGYAQNIPKQENKPEHVGQLLWKGAPLPADWRGAEYDVCQRTLVGVDYPHWHLEFGSKWASERIRVYLDAEKVTGEEAYQLSKTFMEAINQRRMG